MVQCSHCKEWYHKKCIKINNKKLFSIMSKQKNNCYCRNCARVGIVYGKNCFIVQKKISSINAKNGFIKYVHRIIWYSKYNKLNNTNGIWYCFGCSNNRLKQLFYYTSFVYNGLIQWWLFILWWCQMFQYFVLCLGISNVWYPIPSRLF